MTLILKDRILETCSSPGTGAATLLGAAASYQTFSATVGNGNTCYYTIADQNGSNWEVGVGTYVSASNTLARTTVLASSNGGALTNFSSGTQNVFVTYPAGKALYLDESGTFTLAYPQVISVSSASDALRITQTGAGNALVVEDSANPDSTPFVVDASGQVFIGSASSAGATSTGVTPATQIIGTGSFTGTALSKAAIGFYRFFDDNGSSSHIFFKSRSATPGTFTTVQNGDSLAWIRFCGDDGSQFIEAARITAAVDGTPGTNDMPGRLVFSTTADGASSPTERMRISNTGSVGIGSASLGSIYNLRIGKALSGGADAINMFSNVQISNGVTSSAVMYESRPTVENAAFTLSALYHFYANQSTKGASATVTNQFGFFAESSLTGATNNYGFYSNIASGSGRYNFYAAGSADNYFAGRVGIGGTSVGGPYGNIANQTSLTGATGTAGYGAIVTINSDVTSNATVYKSQPTTQASAFTLSQLYHFGAYQYGFGAGSTVTNQYGCFADSTLTGATNNYGFYSNIASGTGRWNFYANGTASNYFGGDTAINVNSSNDALRITQTGAGNALVVEDSANPDSTPFVVDASGYVIQGYTTKLTTQVGGASVTPANQIIGTSLSTSFASVFGFAGANPGFSFSKAQGTIAAPTVVATNNVLGRYSFAGHDGTDFIEAARIQAEVDGTPGTNDMPGRLVFSTTADGASSPTERMRIDNAGRVGIGGTPAAGNNLYLGKALTGATTVYGYLQNATIQSDVTGVAILNSTGAFTAAASFTLTQLRHNSAAQGTFGAGSTVSNQYAFYADSSLTGATNNYGFYSSIPSGTGRYNFYAAGTADNYLAGSLGVGGTPYAGAKLLIGGNATDSNTDAVVITQAIQSSAITKWNGFATYPLLAAGSYTLPTLRHYDANFNTLGAGAAITNQYGFSAQSSLTGATNNYGFYSNIASGTGRWNFYAAGTAANYFAGQIQLAANRELVIGGADAANNPHLIGDGTYLQLNAPNASGDIRFRVAGAERLRIDSSGNVLVTGTGGLGYGTGSGGAVTQATSRTTGVTLNKTNGAITLVSAAGSATYQTFTVTNSTVAATDVIHVSQKSGTDKYIILVTAVAAGSFAITFATTGGTTTEQPVFNFAVLKAVVA